MVPVPCITTEPVPPPAYHRALVQRGPRVRIDALTLVTTLHLLALCRLAVRATQEKPLMQAAVAGDAPSSIRRNPSCSLASCACSGVCPTVI